MNLRGHAGMRVLLRISMVTAFLRIANVCSGLAPYQTALLVNETSQDSLQVANAYARLRGIPEENIIYLRPPRTVLRPRSMISHADFVYSILQPTRDAILQRGLEERIEAWVFSADFPVSVKIRGSKPFSLQGAVLLGEKAPSGETINAGSYINPHYRGPQKPGQKVWPSQSFGRQPPAAGEKAIPSMTLAHMGSRGLDINQVLDLLERGVRGDGTFPRETVYFVRSDDIRSRIREWQFPSAIKALRHFGVRAEIVDHIPENAPAILGLQVGEEKVAPHRCGHFLPGSMAEHLTSHGANFSVRHQTKLTEWLLAGAAASAGTVSEPRAMWIKFPTAYFYVHYAAGCSMIESFYQSVRSPLQLFIVGDPLAKPFSPSIPVAVAALEAGDAGTGKRSFMVDVDPRLRPEDAVYTYVMDGRVLEKEAASPIFSISAGGLSAGHHRLHAVMEWGGRVRHSSSGEISFYVDSTQRLTTLKALSNTAPCPLERPVRFKITTIGSPAGVRVMHGARVLKIVGNAEEGEIAVDPVRLGVGRHRVHAEAVYEGGQVVRSVPVELDVRRMNRPPVITAVDQRPAGKDGLHIDATVTDADGHDLQVQWFRGLAERDFTANEVAKDVRARLAWQAEGVTVEPGTSGGTGIVLGPPVEGDTFELRADVRVADAGRRSGTVGLIFAYKDADDYRYFGYSFDEQAWVIYHVKEGHPSLRAGYARPVDLQRTCSISVRVDKNDVEGLINGRSVCTWSGGGGVSGRIGLIVSKKPSRFERVGVSMRSDDQASSAGSRLLLTSQERKMDKAIITVRDGFSETVEEVEVAK